MKRNWLKVLYALIIVILTMSVFSSSVSSSLASIETVEFEAENDYLTLSDLTWNFGYMLNSESELFNLNSPVGFSYDVDSTTLHVVETTGTFQVWAGGYAIVPVYNDFLNISFEGRAKAGHQDPVLLTVSIYNPDSLVQIYTVEFLKNLGLDTGYHQIDLTYYVEGLDEVILFFGYSDGWSADWGQEIWIRNLRLYNDIPKDFLLDKGVISIMRSNSSFPRGLLYFQDHLWSVVTGTRAFTGVHKYETTSLGDTVNTWSLEHLGWNPYAITTDGEFLYIAVHRTSELYKYDTNFNLQSFTSLSITSHGGMTYDGEYLWIVNRNDQRIYKVDKDTGNSISYIPTPGEGTEGIEFDGTFLWIVDNIENKLYKLSPNDGEILFTYDVPCLYARGITIDDKNYLWLTSALYGYIYKINLKAFESDETPPTVTSESKVIFDEGELNMQINWTIEDSNPEGYEIYKDGTLDYTSVWTHNTTIVYNLGDLATGIYNYTLIVFDTSSNWASKTVIVVILTVEETPYQFSFSMIFVLAVYIFYRKRKHIL